MKWSPEDVGKGNLEITLKIGCSNMCEYCPQTLLIKRYQSPARMMLLEDFKRYVHDIPTTLNFHFTGYVEPFDNPRAHEFMLWSYYQKGHKLKISTTLEGLTKEKYDEIRNIPWVDFSIHLPSAVYSERIGIGKTKDKHPGGRPFLREDWLDLLDYVTQNTPRGVFQVHPHGGCHPQAIPILKKNGINIKEMLLTTRANNTITETNLREKLEDTVPKRKLPPEKNIRGKCARAYQPVLLPDGKLALCCADYGLRHVFGDLSKQTWNQYRKSEKFKHLVNHGADLCDFCDFGVVYMGL